MKRLRSQEGFTLIELVIIILVLGILAATAIPKFYDLSAKAKDAAAKGVIGGVRGGIAIIYASNLLTNVTTFPPTLGGADAAAGPTNLLFSNVLSPGIEDPTWSLANGSEYTAPNAVVYKYDSVAGTIK